MLLSKALHSPISLYSGYFAFLTGTSHFHILLPLLKIEFAYRVDPVINLLWNSQPSFQFYSSECAMQLISSLSSIQHRCHHHPWSRYYCRGGGKKNCKSKWSGRTRDKQSLHNMIGLQYSWTYSSCSYLNKNHTKSTQSTFQHGAGKGSWTPIPKELSSTDGFWGRGVIFLQECDP